jgi:hypothetical protein
MPTIKTTLQELDKGLKLASGAFHIVVLPSTVRVRLVGLLFETDKTFLLPSALECLRALRRLYDDHLGKNVVVCGHVEQTKSSDYSLALSVERSEALAAFLTDDVEDWLSRYLSDQQKSLTWGTREDQYMLSELVAKDGNLYFAGLPSGRTDSETERAVQAFQADNGLPIGTMDTQTRKVLIRQYIVSDDTTLPEGTTVVTHGCGAYHPSSATEDAGALPDHGRIELFFFPDQVAPAPVTPCPEGGCAGYTAWVERSRHTIDVNVDAEGVLFLVDELGLPLRRAPVQVVLPDGKTIDLVTDDHGKAWPQLEQGTSFDVVVTDVHEGGAGDSLTTPSGRHFAAGGDGPASHGGKP